MNARPSTVTAASLIMGLAHSVAAHPRPVRDLSDDVWDAAIAEADVARLHAEEIREDTVAPPLFPRTPSEDELEDERADWGGDL